MALSSGAGTIRRRARRFFRAGPRILKKTGDETAAEPIPVLRTPEPSPG